LRSGRPAGVAQTCYPLSGNMCAMQAVKPTESKSEGPAAKSRRGWLHAGMLGRDGLSLDAYKTNKPHLLGRG